MNVLLRTQTHLFHHMGQVAAMCRLLDHPIPDGFDFHSLSGLATEAKEKLSELRPRTLGAASRIAGVRPPDVALLSVHLERQRRARVDQNTAAG